MISGTARPRPSQWQRSSKRRPGGPGPGLPPGRNGLLMKGRDMTQRREVPGRRPFPPPRRATRPPRPTPGPATTGGSVPFAVTGSLAVIGEGEVVELDLLGHLSQCREEADE